MNDAFNKALIQKHEGRRLVAYKDTRGFLTIAAGFNLETGSARNICQQVGVDYAAICSGAAITDAQADAIFELQYDAVAGQARTTFPTIDSYPENLAAVICDLIYELGQGGFLLFHNTILAIKALDIPGVIAGIKDSALATQVPNRVADNISLLEAIPA